jgi:hypothetical protein
MWPQNLDDDFEWRSRIRLFLNKQISANEISAVGKRQANIPKFVNNVCDGSPDVWPSGAVSGPNGR